MRQDACKRHDGCMKPGCPWKGVDRDWRVMQADHLDPKGLQDPANKKVHAVSQYKWWSGNGGVPAMRLEAAKCQWICGFCHSLEPTSKSARRCGNPADMPAGKSSGTKEEKKQYEAKRNATIKYPKQQHVDAAKLRIGCCAKCDRSVAKETCVAFQFDHIDETTKLIGKDTLAGKKWWRRRPRQQPRQPRRARRDQGRPRRRDGQVPAPLRQLPQAQDVG